jgi:hypothetical protein
VVVQLLGAEDHGGGAAACCLREGSPARAMAARTGEDAQDEGYFRASTTASLFAL